MNFASLGSIVIIAIVSLALFILGPLCIIYLIKYYQCTSNKHFYDNNKDYCEQNIIKDNLVKLFFSFFGLLIIIVGMLFRIKEKKE